MLEIIVEEYIAYVKCIGSHQPQKPQNKQNYSKSEKHNYRFFACLKGTCNALIKFVEFTGVYYAGPNASFSKSSLKPFFISHSALNQSSSGALPFPIRSWDNRYAWASIFSLSLFMGNPFEKFPPHPGRWGLVLYLPDRYFVFSTFYAFNIRNKLAYQFLFSFVFRNASHRDDAVFCFNLRGNRAGGAMKQQCEFYESLLYMKQL